MTMPASLPARQGCCLFELARLQGFEFRNFNRLKSLLVGEPARPLSDQHRMIALFHHSSSRRDWMSNTFNAGDTACSLVWPIHDACVELRVAGCISCRTNGISHPVATTRTQ
ncbi:MAG: hypothetical protein ACI841_001079 [Planctomycetota bacterium]|jgi:hypothetical protein